MPLRIYLAAPFSEMPLMQKWAKLLQDNGHICTSRWLDADPKDPWGDGKVSAQTDLEDIDDSDALISFVLPNSTYPRGSRHVEFGYALAKGKIMINIGPGSENIFHDLPQVTVFEKIEDAIVWLNKTEK